MQDINLLQNKLKDRSESWEKGNRIMIAVFSLLLIAVLVLGGGLFLTNYQTDKTIEQVKSENSVLTAKLNSQQGDMIGAKAFQAQIQNIRVLLGSHIVWTPFYEELIRNTLTKTTYSYVRLGLDGKVHVEGNIGSYDDLGKLLYGLSQSGKFTEVKLLNASSGESEAGGYTFSIDFKVKPEIFQETK
ncbi:MAG: PilN domain-containing protein [Candidatus Saccharibacteria bacterium]